MLGGHLLDRFARFMRTLEKAGQLSRRIEYLPDDEEVLDRLRRGEGLSRAEIAVLLSYSKLVLYEQLLESNLPDDAYFATDLAADRSEERRVGKEWVSACRPRGSPEHKKKKQKNTAT